MEPLKTTTMTGHERLACALEHREPDRVPFDLGGTMVSGINMNALKALRTHLGLEAPAHAREEMGAERFLAGDVLGFGQ